jgi:hypothetical protein
MTMARDKPAEVTFAESPHDAYPIEFRANACKADTASRTGRAVGAKTGRRRGTSSRPRFAVAIPAFNEVERVVACVGALLGQARGGPDMVVVMANNCVDGTAVALHAAFGDHPRLDVREVVLPPALAHVGWARRLAMDAAADHLDRPTDVLATTDADTVVAPNWCAANRRHLADGYQVVAGAAHLMRLDRAQLSPGHRRRLLLAARYFAALAYLRADPAEVRDPWPRHDYEGGASIAMRLGTYRAMGGSPILPTGEDRALFDAARAVGAQVRHAVDVRVFTSCRLSGRASGGTADTLKDWGAIGEHEPAHGLPSLDTLRIGEGAALLSFAQLPGELALARALVRERRAGLSLAA